MRKTKRIAKPVIADTVSYVKANVATLPSHTKAYTLAAAGIFTSLESLVRGKVAQSDVNDLTSMAYMSLALYNLGVGVDDKKGVIDGVKAINSINSRYITQRVYRGTGPEITAIRELVGIHISQLNETTPGLLKDAIIYVKQSLALDAARKKAEKRLCT